MAESEEAEALAPPAERREQDLIGLSRKALAAEVAALGEPAFRARQLWQWLYGKGATDFEAMTSLSKTFRAKLAGGYRISRPEVCEALLSKDGTRKWLLQLAGGHRVETVHIPDGERGTLCVSSQVGCTLTCRFCHTGTQRLVRNLTAAEIVGQVLLAKDRFGEWPASRPGRAVTNLVFMGMGEPLYNFENVAEAIHILRDGEGLGISKRKITLSTAGVVPAMQRCGEELGVNLAVSLHAATDEIRDRIVPLNRKYPLAELIAACRDYPGLHNARRITFEYVMLQDVNDSDRDAEGLARLIEGIPAKTNLIPFNPWPGAPYRCSAPERVRRFARILNGAGLAAPVRTPRGQDIMAACGQLKSASERLRRSRRQAA
ncbi:MAG: 23S rRNA (adenine(2503)-C(2))-methyltransferase RlmN [Rhodospirillales bacterium]|nr:23S rRNA (adenine(2503)-C(2))-methyltransferase RlmN [Rhodospirillales bacterium]